MRLEGKYRGIVIQNNDPKHEGRVKVFVPGVNLQQLKNWNQKKEENKYFKVMGENTNSSLTRYILEDQKERLFWAEVALPIVGMSAPGYYHAPSDIYYIGNDSNYLFQDSNKSNILFSKDRNDELNRPPVVYSTTVVQPRTSIILNFSNYGSRYCFSNDCGSSGGNIPSFVNPSKITNPCLKNIFDTLPRIYTSPSLSAVFPKPNYGSSNAASEITINVTNPQIEINDVVISNDNPVYNPCVTENEYEINYSPSIEFEDSDDAPANTVEEIPVNILINNKNTLNRKFILDYSDESKQIYKSGTVKVTVPVKNIRNIKIKKNKNFIDIAKILAIFNFVVKMYNSIIMPRAPMNNGQPMIVRGGGGGEIYNNVTTGLLDEQKRRNSHIGGANNESKFTINHGRTALNNENNLKGSNVQTNATQIYRGPLRSADYNNDWKGLISIPGVGSHVWVRFENGNINYPIVDGTFASKADYMGVFEID